MYCSRFVVRTPVRSLPAISQHNLPAKSRSSISILNFFPPNRGIDFYFEFLPAKSREERGEKWREGLSYRVILPTSRNELTEMRLQILYRFVCTSRPICFLTEIQTSRLPTSFDLHTSHTQLLFPSSRPPATMIDLVGHYQSAGTHT